MVELGKSTLQVRPFKNLSKPSEVDYVVDGITDSVRSELTKFQGLCISSSALDEEVSDYVVQGSYLNAGIS